MKSMNIFLKLLLIISFIHTIQGNFFEKKYGIIKKYLTQYTRPFTIIEVNPPSDESYSLLISKEFKSTCLVFGSNNYDALTQTCIELDTDNMVIASQADSTFYFERLSECEHFDVVLIPSIKWEKNNIAINFKQLIALGDHTIIELLSTKNDLPQEQLILDDKKLNLLERVHDDNTKTINSFYISYNPRNSLLRRRWNAGPTEKRFYKLTSTFHDKSFIKKHHTKPIAWHHGINLLTFAKLQGSYPLKLHIVEQIRSFNNVAHGDFAIGNMIIQGKTVKLIDWDEAHKPQNIEKRMKRVVAKFLFLLSTSKHKKRLFYLYAPRWSFKDRS